MPAFPFDHLLVLLLAGLAAGFLSGLAGMGGALLLVPVLAYFGGMPFKAATATAAFHGLAVGIMATTVHRKHGAVDTGVAWRTSLGSVVGALAGAAISGIASTTAVQWIYVASAVLALVLLLLRPESSVPSDERVPAASARALGIGSLTGVIAGIVGAGGAFILVPLMRSVLRMGVHRAIGTAMLVSILTGLTATVGKAALGQLPGLDALVVVLGSALGTRSGASLTHRIPAVHLRRLLLLIVLLLVARTVSDLLLG